MLCVDAMRASDGEFYWISGSGDVAVGVWVESDAGEFERSSSLRRVYDAVADMQCVYANPSADNALAMLLVRFSGGQLELWDASTLLLLKRWKNAVLSMTPICTKGADTMLAMVLSSGELIVEALSLTEVRTTVTVHKAIVPNSTLLPAPTAGLPGSFLLFGPYAKSNTLYGFLAVQSNSSANVKSLIASGDFPAAVALASEQCPAELPEIHKAHLEALLCSLCGGTDSVDTVLGSVKSCLGVLLAVEGGAYAEATVERCLSLSNCSVETYRKLLAVLDSVHKTEDVGETAKRLETYVDIAQADHLDPTAWNQFRTAPPHTTVTRLLGLGRLDAVRLVTSRHGLPSLTKTSLLTILDAIPAVPAAVQWISDELLPLVPNFCRPTLFAWMHERALALERSGMAQDALTLCEAVLGGVEKHVKDDDFLITPGQQVRRAITTVKDMGKEAGSDHGTESALERLVEDLREVVHLENVHGLTVKVDDLRKMGRRQVVFAMLDRVVAPDLLASAIHTQVGAYATRHEMNPDLDIEPMLLDYCAETFQDSTQVSGSVCEQRVIAIYRCVRSTDVKGAILLLLIRHLLPPYSPELLECLSDEVAAEIEAEIHEQKRLMRIRAIVSKYKVASFDFANPTHARQLMNAIVAIAACKTELQEEVIADCEILAESYHSISMEQVFTALLQNIALLSIESRNCDNVVHRIQQCMAGVNKAETVMQVLYFCEEFLLHGAKEEAFPNALVASTVGKAALEQNRFVLGDDDARIVQTMTNSAAALCRLAMDFDIELSLSQLREGPEAAFREIIEGEKHSAMELFAIGHLLHIPAPKVVAELASRSCRIGDFDGFKEMSAKLDGTSAETVCVAIEAMLHMDEVNATVLYQCAKDCLSRSVLKQPAGKLSDCLQLLRSCALIGQLLELCETGNYEDAGPQAEATNCPPWRAWFVENANVLNEKELVPRIKAFLMELEASRNSTQETSQSLVSKCNNLVDYLVKNSATQHALAVVMTMDPSAVNRDAAVRAQIEQIIRALAQKAIKYRAVDAHLILAYLCSIEDKAQAFTIFREELPNVQENYLKLGELAKVGESFGARWGMAEVEQDCATVHKNARWWHRLSQLQVSFDVRKFTALKEGALKAYVGEELLPTMIVKSSFDLDETVAFARGYGIAKEEVCRVFFSLVLKDPNLSDYETKLAPVIPVLRSEIKSLARTALSNIQGDDYKRLLFVHKLLLGASVGAEQQAELRARVHVLEYLMMDHNFPAPIDFNNLCARPWETIEEILSASTIKRLIGLSHPLHLDPDQFYIRLIHKLTANGEREEQTLQLLKCIGNAKLAVETAEAIAEKAKLWKNKLEILKLALKTAKANGYTIGESRIMPKVNEAATSLDIQHFIGEDARAACKEWVRDPSEMCCQLLNLYHGHKNIHDVTEAISDRYSLDICKLRRYIVTVWLTSLRVNGGWQESSAKEISDLVEKTVHALARNDEERNVTFLLTFVFKKRCIFKAKEIALGALFRLVDPQKVESICLAKRLDLPDLQTYWQYCGYMALFEEMGSSQNIDDLIACDKLGLIRALWRDHRDNTIALRLIAVFLIDFKLQEEKLVSALEKQLNKLQQTDLLRQFSRAYEALQKEDLAD